MYKQKGNNSNFIECFMDQLYERIKYDKNIAKLQFKTLPPRVRNPSVPQVISAVFNMANFIGLRYGNYKFIEEIMNYKDNWAIFAAESIIESSYQVANNEPGINIPMPSDEDIFGRIAIYFFVLEAVLSVFLDYLAGRPKPLMFDGKINRIKIFISDKISETKENSS